MSQHQQETSTNQEQQQTDTQNQFTRPKRKRHIELPMQTTKEMLRRIKDNPYVWDSRAQNYQKTSMRKQFFIDLSTELKCESKFYSKISYLRENK